MGKPQHGFATAISATLDRSTLPESAAAVPPTGKDKKAPPPKKGEPPPVQFAATLSAGKIETYCIDLREVALAITSGCELADLQVISSDVSRCSYRWLSLRLLLRMEIHRRLEALVGPKR